MADQPEPPDSEALARHAAAVNRAREFIRRKREREQQAASMSSQGDTAILVAKAPDAPTHPASLGGAIPIKTTMPAELRRHNISDEELDMLIDAKHNSAEAFAWAMLAMATGAAPSTLEALWFANFASPKIPLGAVDQIGFFIFVASLALGIAFFVFATSKEKAGTTLGDKIRARSPQ